MGQPGTYTAAVAQPYQSAAEVGQIPVIVPFSVSKTEPLPIITQSGHQTQAVRSPGQQNFGLGGGSNTPKVPGSIPASHGSNKTPYPWYRVRSAGRHALPILQSPPDDRAGIHFNIGGYIGKHRLAPAILPKRRYPLGNGVIRPCFSCGVMARRRALYLSLMPAFSGRISPTGIGDSFKERASSGDASSATIARANSTATPAPFAVMIRHPLPPDRGGAPRPSSSCSNPGKHTACRPFKRPLCPKIARSGAYRAEIGPRFVRPVQYIALTADFSRFRVPGIPRQNQRLSRKAFRIVLFMSAVTVMPCAPSTARPGVPIATVTVSRPTRRKISTVVSASISSKPGAKRPGSWTLSILSTI